LALLKPFHHYSEHLAITCHTTPSQLTHIPKLGFFSTQPLHQHFISLIITSRKEIRIIVIKRENRTGEETTMVVEPENVFRGFKIALIKLNFKGYY